MNREYTINCKQNETVLDALRRQGITIKAFCNGHQKCGKCRVLLDETDLCEASYGEMKLLSDDENARGVRLACFAVPNSADMDELKVTILDELENDAPILTESGYTDKTYGTSINTFAAFDLGTTTIAAKLIRSGKDIYTGTCRNSQCSYGADVLSRSEASIGGAGDVLAACIRKDIDSLLDEFPVTPEHLVFAGNTTIIHLLMNYPLDKMVVYPFTPYRTGWIRDRYITGDGEEFDCTIIPAQSAYIGGDIVSGLYYCDFASSDRVSLFVDLGTNGEMAIGNRYRILTASAAAGPAFEGTHINVATDVIKCMAQIRNSGIIDENGLLKDAYFDSGYPYNTGNGHPVIIRQNDIRDIQMAKSAIRSGLEILMERYGAAPGDIDRLYLAGGMGYGLDIDSALSIGLFPPELRDKAVPAGNTSLAGCIRYGVSERDDTPINNILKASQEIVLSNEPDFSDKYYEYMMF